MPQFEKGEVAIDISLMSPVARLACQITGRWPPHSRLFVIGERGRRWVLAEEVAALRRVAGALGIRTPPGLLWKLAARQALFFGSRYDLFTRLPHLDSSYRLATSYFHGRPGTDPRFDELYRQLSHAHSRLSRIHVSHSEMRDIVLGTGIDPNKVFLIPIGIELSWFPRQTAASRQRVRAALKIPHTAIVIGSFQKDGSGWGEGNEPKPVKGPDLFLKVAERLRDRVGELFVLLTGPSRGYVKSGLNRLRIPYRHVSARRYRQIGLLYHALDAYVVTSRQEGGPKAVLESMAAGVPLITTRVGQAMDLVRHGENGWMVDVEDVDGLTHWTEQALTRSDLGHVRDRARLTAEGNCYTSQIPQWRAFMNGFVD